MFEKKDEKKDEKKSEPVKDALPAQAKIHDTADEMMEEFTRETLKILTPDELEKANAEAQKLTFAEQALVQLRIISKSLVGIAFILFILTFGAFCFFLGKGEYLVSLVTGVLLPFLVRVLQLLTGEKGKQIAQVIQNSLRGKR